MAIKNYTTSVPAFQSIGEIQGALAGHGAERIIVDYKDGKPTGISFVLNTSMGMHGFVLPASVDGTLRAFAKQKVKQNREQAEKTAWRNVRDWVLAQIALIESCDMAIEEPFLPYLADQKGNTLFDAFQSGKLFLPEGKA